MPEIKNNEVEGSKAAEQEPKQPTEKDKSKLDPVDSPEANKNLEKNVGKAQQEKGSEHPKLDPDNGKQGTENSEKNTPQSENGKLTAEAPPQQELQAREANPVVKADGNPSNEGNAKKAEGTAANEGDAKKTEGNVADEGDAKKAEGNAANEGDAKKADGNVANEGDAKKADGNAADEGDAKKADSNVADEGDVKDAEKPSPSDTKENPELDKLKNEYFDDLKNRSEYPDTINDGIKDNNWEKISPEENAKMREDFAKNKGDLIGQWEKDNGMEWPTYKEDVYSPSGKQIRSAGDKYDAHHIQPLTYGGQNEASNLTPMHASEHFDKQGVHAPNSPFGQMDQLYKEN